MWPSLKRYALLRYARSVRLTVSADTKFSLWINGEYAGSGPPTPGGDYANNQPMPKYYANSFDLPINADSIENFAQVALSFVVMTDYSCGRGGFSLSARVEYAYGGHDSFQSVRFSAFPHRKPCA